MPTILREGPYRVYFYSTDGKEPPHVHVDRGDCSVKIWLHNLEVARNIRLPLHEVRRVRELVEEHREEFLRAWHGYFPGSGR